MADETNQTKTATRTASVLFGIPQLGLTHVDRQVPVDEPPPLPENAKLKYVGKPTVRYDGAAKASGRGKYTADVHLPGMLYAYVRGADVPQGKILSIDTTAAERYPGVKAVYVVEHEYGGEAELRDPSKEVPSKYPIVRYAGQAIAEDAAKLIEVKYDPLDFVVDRADARKTDAPLVFPGPADAAGSAGGGG